MSDPEPGTRHPITDTRHPRLERQQPLYISPRHCTVGGAGVWGIGFRVNGLGAHDGGGKRYFGECGTRNWVGLGTEFPWETRGIWFT